MNNTEKQSFFKNDDGDLNGFGYTTIGVIITIIIIVIIIGLMIGIPQYKVWSKGLKGEAQLREAEYSKQVLIEEAKANLEAEKLNAQAEVEKAKGMAKSMEIENGKLTDEYIKYLWVKNMNDSQNTKIYIPTEAGLPILEAK